MPSISMTFRICATLLAILVVTGCASIGTVIAPIPTSAAPLSPVYRIVVPGTVAEATLAQMIELLDAIGRMGRPVVLSLEMFERDVQTVVDDYLAGRVSESEFLARSRPWDRYATDYRRLIELAKEHHWRVVAANVPRPLALAIGRKGLAALDTLTPKDRNNAAGDNRCPRDDYHARFMESMQSHSPGSGTAPQVSDSLPTAT